MSRAGLLLADTIRRRRQNTPAKALEKLDQITRDLNRVQRQFFDDTHRRVCGLTPRRAGKTTGVLARISKQLITTRRTKYPYIALSKPMAEEILWDELKKWDDRYELGLKFDNTRLKAKYPGTGSVVHLVGADDKKEVDKLRGQKYPEAAIDEAASFNAPVLLSLIDKVLGPALMDLRGPLVLVGTPSHILTGPFYDATRNGSKTSRPWEERDDPKWAGAAVEWSRHHWSLQDNTAMPHLWEEALAIKAFKGWSDENPIWQREYLGRWVGDDTDRVYRFREYAEDEQSKLQVPWNIWEPGPKTSKNPYGLPEGHHWRYVIGLDLGFVDNFAMQVLAYSDTCPNLYQVYEYSAPGLHIRPIAELIRGVVAKIGYYPDGMVADLAGSGGTILLELAEVYGLAVEAAEKKDKPAFIELVNSDLVDGRIKILKGSGLATEWLELQWDPDRPDKENKAQANHCSDAFVYARRKAMHHFSHAAVAKPRPGSPEANEAERIAAEERLIAREAAMQKGEWDRDHDPAGAEEAWWSGQDDGDLWR